MNMENDGAKEVTKEIPLSERDFALLGMNDLAYIRAVTVESGTGFMIHAADGSPLGVVADRETAFVAARQHGLEPRSVH
jgi:hypothetical protein